MEIKKEIVSAIERSLVKLIDSKINFLVEKPENENFGDYSSNVSLVLAKILKKNPYELAQEFTKKLTIPNIEKIEAVKPGFINFYLAKNYLIDNLQVIADKKEGYGRGESLKDRKIMVEFTDPNPFKEFHIGHLYTNTVGESVSRLLGSMGANLKRANYQGDVGMHVAKALYGLLSREFKVGNLEEKSLKEKVKIMGEAYAYGSKVYEDDDVKKKEIEQLNKKIYAKDPSVVGLYEKGRQWSLEYFETIYKRLGTKFDYYYFESEVGVNGLELVKEYLAKNIFEKSQGAIIFPGKKYGLHDRVFINSLGLPTYEAKDLGLALKKYTDFKYDQSITVTGNEIIGYFKVVLMALKQINPEIASKIKHLTHGMVRLPSGKMSSRSGNIVTGQWLLDETKKILKNKFSEMSEDILEKVAVGSVKYALLKSSLGRDIEFDFEESTSIQGNSGPYLQYTFARTQSVLAKTTQKVENESKRRRLFDLEPEEKDLLRVLIRFPEIVSTAGEKFAPNTLCNYLFDLAQKFNLFYQKCKIIGSKEEDFRLELTAGVGQVIRNGLNLLGIQAPDKM